MNLWCSVDLIDNQTVGSRIGTDHRFHLSWRLNLLTKHLGTAVIAGSAKKRIWTHLKRLEQEETNHKYCDLVLNPTDYRHLFCCCGQWAKHDAFGNKEVTHNKKWTQKQHNIYLLNKHVNSSLSVMNKTKPVDQFEILKSLTHIVDGTKNSTQNAQIPQKTNAITSNWPGVHFDHVISSVSGYNMSQRRLTKSWWTAD